MLLNQDKFGSKITLIAMIIIVMSLVFSNAVGKGNSSSQFLESDPSFIHKLLNCSLEEQEAVLRDNISRLNIKIWNELNRRALLAQYRQDISESGRIYR